MKWLASALPLLFLLLSGRGATNMDESVISLSQINQNSLPQYYQYAASEYDFKSSRSDIVSPSYYVYAGNLDLEGAKQLVLDLGIVNNLQEWGSTIRIIQPIDHKGYTEQDAKAFVKLAANEVVRNVKVIGIHEGATFVNNYLSDEGYFVAGVMLYGGTVDKNRTLSTAIPAYLSNTTGEVQKYYVRGNEAVQQVSPDSKFNFYVNKENKLKQVVIHNQNESLKTAFRNAWEHIFSRNYRMHNEEVEFYLSNPLKNTGEYPLTGIPNFKELGLTYHPMIDQPVNGKGKYMWYEYVPRNMNTYKTQSIPLIVTLHGTGNDPRIQGDTSGWTELASTEKFIVVSPEWEDKARNFNKNEGLGDDGVINLVQDLQKKYPQIDPARIYVTGLSAGGSKAALYGVKYSDVFAAAASVSAPGVDKKELTAIASQYKGGAVPYLYVSGDRDYFQMIPVDGSGKYGQPGIFQKDPNVSMFEFLQAYQRVNQLAVSKAPDMTVNPYYGIQLEHQGWSKLGDKDMYSGTLSNDKGVMMKLVAIKDLAHWNYKPEAQLIWDFFENYKRNTANGELIVNHVD